MGYTFLDDKMEVKRKMHRCGKATRFGSRHAKKTPKSKPTLNTPTGSPTSAEASNRCCQFDVVFVWPATMRILLPVSKHP